MSFIQLTSQLFNHNIFLFLCFVCVEMLPLSLLNTAVSSIADFLWLDFSRCLCDHNHDFFYRISFLWRWWYTTMIWGLIWVVHLILWSMSLLVLFAEWSLIIWNLWYRLITFLWPQDVFHHCSFRTENLLSIKLKSHKTCEALWASFCGGFSLSSALPQVQQAAILLKWLSP